MKPGDTIIVTNGDLPSLIGKKFTIIEDDKYQILPSEIVIRLPRNCSCWIDKSCCELVEPEKAQVGDIIILHRGMSGEECVVVDCDICPSAVDDISQCVWATVNKKNHGGAFWTPHGSYKIVRRATTKICPDCNGTGEITLFSSTVKCECARHQR